MENSKVKRTTNRTQFEKMVSLMTEHSDIAKNLTKTDIDTVVQFWQKLQHGLNALGPPIKETAEWKKVWSDHESSLRKKLAHNKRVFTTTGGGVNTQVVFTRLEEEVIRLVCLRDCVDGGTNTKSFGVPGKQTFTEANIESVSLLNAPRTKVPKILQLLEEQINIQQKLYDDFALFMKNNDERSEEANACERQKHTNVILQTQLIENKRYNEKMEHLALDKNKTKMRILEIELIKSELD